MLLKKKKKRKDRRKNIRGGRGPITKTWSFCGFFSHNSKVCAFTKVQLVQEF
jgi:hypothetical protein